MTTNNWGEGRWDICVNYTSPNSRIIPCSNERLCVNFPSSTFSRTVCIRINMNVYRPSWKGIYTNNSPSETVHKEGSTQTTAPPCIFYSDKSVYWDPDHVLLIEGSTHLKGKSHHWLRRANGVGHWRSYKCRRRW